MNKSIKIMLIEDNREFRDVIEFSLADEADMEVVSQYGSAEFALRVIKDRPNTGIPDVILLDLQLTGMNGLDAIPRFLEILPKVQIIILSQSDNERDVLAAIATGASGYLLKSSTVAQVIEGIRIVMSGGSSIDPSVAIYLLKKLRVASPSDVTGGILTERELEILNLLAEGLVKKEISDQLGITYRTVDTHVRHIYEKLDVRNGPAAVNMAYKLGLFRNS
ncbi:MAG: LuxR C-terminal-related transcriptional regulator [Opitutaceae bacterium]